MAAFRATTDSPPRESQPIPAELRVLGHREQQVRPFVDDAANVIVLPVGISHQLSERDQIAAFGDTAPDLPVNQVIKDRKSVVA